jgi:DNA-binding MarR family transcriptional regulator
MNFVKDKNFELIKAIKKTNNQILKQESEIVRKHKLTPSQYGVLESLYIKGDMCINELIRRQISTSGTMTVIVKNLEKLEYIEKKINSDDKRYFDICLTNKGKKIVEEVLPERIQQLEDFTSIFTEEDKDNLLQILYKVKNKYKEKASE